MSTANVLEPSPFLPPVPDPVLVVSDVLRCSMRRVQSSPHDLFVKIQTPSVGLAEPRQVQVEVVFEGDSGDSNTVAQKRVEYVSAWSTDLVQVVKKKLWACLSGTSAEWVDYELFVGGVEVADEDVLDWLVDKDSSNLQVVAREVGEFDYASRCNKLNLDADKLSKSMLPSSALTLALDNVATAIAGSQYKPQPIFPQPECSGHLPVKCKIVCESDTRVSTPRDQGAVHLLVHKQPEADGVIDNSRRSFEFQMDSSVSVGSFQRQLALAHGLENFKHRLLLDGKELCHGKSLKEYGVNKGSVIELVPMVEENGIDRFPSGSPTLQNPDHELFKSFAKAQEGLASGKFPELASSGSGGSYFLKSANGANVAVFKPEDEEPMALHNPKGMSSSVSDFSSSSGLRKGIRPGEGAVREVIAFLIDHEHFAGVPPTALVNLVAHGLDDCVKVGSLQDFVEADFDCEERGTWAFPTSEVHKIAILDIRLANTDRNAGNILAKQDPVTKEWTLTPIDHGYALPDSFEDITFEWMYWPQAEKPFDETTLRYIRSMDADRDLNLMWQHNLHIRPDCERVFRVCTSLLKMAAEKGFCAYDIARIICREDDFNRSPIELLDDQARHQCELEANFSVASYVEKMEELMATYLENYSEDKLLDGLY